MQVVSNCSSCQKLRQSLPRPPPLKPVVPQRPMQALGTDLFHEKGKNWMVVVDRYSGYPFAKKLQHTGTSSITDNLTEIFQEQGYPDSIRCDGGPQFRQQFGSFCKSVDVSHEQAAAYDPRSNGLAEAAVKQVKFLIKKCAELKQSFLPAFYAWRATPRADGFSPFEIFYGRKPNIPVLPAFKKSDYVPAAAEEARMNTAIRNATNSSRGTKVASQLSVGERVLIQDSDSGLWSLEGEVVTVRPHGRSYIVAAGGTTYLRARQHLRPLPRKNDDEDDDAADDGDSAADENEDVAPARHTRSRAHIARRRTAQSSEEQTTTVSTPISEVNWQRPRTCARAREERNNADSA